MIVLKIKNKVFMIYKLSILELTITTIQNNYFANLVDQKQLFQSFIYCLWLVEPKTLKNYIKINLANSFIKYFMLIANILILFIRKKTKAFSFISMIKALITQKFESDIQYFQLENILII